LLGLLAAAIWVVACGLNPHPEPPLTEPSLSPPTATAAGSGGSSNEAGAAGNDDNGAGTVNSPEVGGASGMATSAGGEGAGAPALGPDNNFDAADAGAVFPGDSGSFDATTSVVSP
jgi:hypothetical protein